ncbi:hypothetical protein [Bradyrhizobium sp. BR 10289]|uniref:hypothetical protein n=1 Tax=Bradyrhizobium sp. BR 10289 TaxID=2749993 RepID=UPI001C648D9F|nr:hypothetical protein [Bradyrhizobium sp. BR 10289]MBW7968399.1 hypothetical protein [Bradyrhizobium sp. BR 10289]
MRTLPITIAVLASLALGAAGLLLLPAKEADAGRTVTTEQAAADAGAKVLPTDPKLRIEPK